MLYQEACLSLGAPLYRQFIHQQKILYLEACLPPGAPIYRRSTRTIFYIRRRVCHRCSYILSIHTNFSPRKMLYLEACQSPVLLYIPSIPTMYSMYHPQKILYLEACLKTGAPIYRRSTQWVINRKCPVYMYRNTGRGHQNATKTPTKRRLFVLLIQKIKYVIFQNCDFGWVIGTVNIVKIQYIYNQQLFSVHTVST